ncbi:CC0125/CC1285 family lipoprotein [Gilvimarinus sp. F26214L]|uniref:CC0125/CC1285 family lipoprotein n=1 Tax=Gilvimarinus sp. DZF01 TaxID=3461371 RepID=UPI0040452C3B
MNYTRPAAFLLLVLFAGCATQPLYSPATRPDQPGYWETRLTDTRYRVTFVGRSSTSSEEVKNLALLRAAELTIAAGYDWFRIVDRESSAQTRRDDPRVSIGVGSGCYPYGCRVVGSRWYTGVHLDSWHYADRYRSSMEILMGKGEPGDPNRVYDARELARHLQRSPELD